MTKKTTSSNQDEVILEGCKEKNSGFAYKFVLRPIKVKYEDITVTIRMRALTGSERMEFDERRQMILDNSDEEKKTEELYKLISEYIAKCLGWGATETHGEGWDYEFPPSPENLNPYDYRHKIPLVVFNKLFEVMIDMSLLKERDLKNSDTPPKSS
jgi:hypothetical protein